LIAKALKYLPEDIHLVLVGKETQYTEQIHTFAKTEKLESRIHILHGIPFTDLPAVYWCAEVFAYPSRYEGFGIPILEALNSRLPVVAATGSCLEEAGGPDSLYVNPDSAEEMAQAINKAMQPAQREYMIDKGLAWAAQFSKEQMARQTMQCYNKLIKSGNIQL
jgi:glycosyltransferase involved in cell wall biosynthesis